MYPSEVVWSSRVRVRKKRRLRFVPYNIGDGAAKRMAKLMKPQIMLSPSALNLFLECARCFWLEKVKKIKRPRGIFPSLPGGMDRIIKTYFDSYRSQVIPP